jgi:hypothetical protein
LSHVYGSVTSNNGFWIGRLVLLTPSFIVLLNCNQLQQLTINDCLRLSPFWLDYDCLLFYSDWLVSDLRITHFWFMIDLVLGSPYYRDCLELWLTYEHLRTYLDGCLYSVAVSQEVFVACWYPRVRLLLLQQHLVTMSVCLLVLYPWTYLFNTQWWFVSKSHLHGNVFASSFPRNSLRVIILYECLFVPCTCSL